MAVHVGSKYQGKVTGITHFGAFVELDEGVTGLVHISEVADNYVEDIRDFLTINDIVTVKVLNIGEDGKIGLSIRKAQDGWEERSRASSNRRDRRHGGRAGKAASSNLDEMISRFMKDSEDRLTSLRRQESKRGGRGGRRG